MIQVQDKKFDVKLDFAHLEGCRMAMPHQVADQPFIIPDGLGAFPIRNARSLNDRSVIAHVINHTDKSVIEHRENLVKAILKRTGSHARRGSGESAKFFDLEVDGAGLVCFVTHRAVAVANSAVGENAYSHIAPYQ